MRKCLLVMSLLLFVICNSQKKDFPSEKSIVKSVAATSMLKSRQQLLSALTAFQLDSLSNVYNILPSIIDTLFIETKNGFKALTKVESIQIGKNNTFVIKDSLEKKKDYWEQPTICCRLILKLSLAYDTLVDKIDSVDYNANVSYRFIYYYEKIGYYLIYLQRPEDGGYFLVNSETGKHQPIAGVPYFSNNLSRFICPCVDAEVEGCFFTVYRLGNDSISEDFTRNFDCLSNNLDPKWLNDTSFKVSRTVDINDTEKVDSVYTFIYDPMKYTWKEKHLE